MRRAVLTATLLLGLAAGPVATAGAVQGRTGPHGYVDCGRMAGVVPQRVWILQGRARVTCDGARAVIRRFDRTQLPSQGRWDCFRGHGSSPWIYGCRRPAPPAATRDLIGSLPPGMRPPLVT